ncbi:MAG: sulfatase [Planctomycetota bacterium]
MVARCVLGRLLLASVAAAAEPPNVVIIFIDDMGYADIGPFGCEAYPTPHLDQMAAEGRVFTDFHAVTAVCSASRAGLLTGCYAQRIGIRGALFPGDRVGLNPAEVTLAELCSSRGYATGCFGKWHLGDLPEHLPTRHGFDEWFGLPYSNDMWRYPDGETTLKNGAKKHRGAEYPNLPLYENESIYDADVTPEDQKQLTTQYTERAVAFIDRHAGKRPFFVYLPHTMVHIPLFVSDKFAGKSGAGIYGDVVIELDWSVGQVMAALERGGVAENTLVVFTSDNGPWLSYGDHAGSAGPLREGKGTMWEGGYREPCVMRWPARIPAGTTCDEFCSTIDLVPTVAEALQADLPTHPIDGRNILPLMTDDEAVSPHEVFYCYYVGQLQAVRDRRWKLTLPHKYRTLGDREPGSGGKGKGYRQTGVGIRLFDLKNDVSETTDVAADHPKVVARLLAAAEAARADLGDSLTDRVGSGVRPAAHSPPR